MEDKKNPNIDYSQNAQTEPNVEEIPFDQLPKKEQRRRIKETKKKAKYDKKVKKALNAQKGRGLKNFIWWLVGFLSSFIIAASAIFVCVKLVPLKTFLGENSDEVATEEVTSKSLVDIFMAMDEFKVSDVKILENVLTDLLSSSGIDSIINIDMNKLGELQFVYPEGSGKDFGSEIQNCFKVSKELFGDLAKLPIFENTLVPTDKIPEANVDSNFAPQIYYYLESGDISDDTAVLKPAYNADKTRVEESIDKDIYYVSLDAIPFGDMMDSISARLAPVKLSSMLDAFSEGASSSMIGKVLGDTTVSGLSTLNANGILLNDVMPYDKDTNGQLYDILCSAVGDDATNETLTIGDLTGMSIDNVLLSTFFGEGENDLLNILCSIAGDGVNSENINVGHITSLSQDDFNKIKLNDVIPYDEDNADVKELYDLLLQSVVREGDDAEEVKIDNLTLGDLAGVSGKIDFEKIKVSKFIKNNTDNESLYKILLDLTGKTNAEDITLGDLNGLDISTLELVNILDKNDYSNFYSILTDATGKTADEITLAQLKSFNVEQMHLSAVLDTTENKQLYDILREAIVRPSGSEAVTNENLTVGDFEYFSVDQIKLSSVLPLFGEDDETPTNRDLYKILAQASGLKKEDFENNEEKMYSSIKINSISSFNIDSILLTTVLPKEDNEGLYKILMDATGVEDSSNLTISSLSDFEIGDVRLHSVIESSTDPILGAVLAKDTEENPLTISNLGYALHELKITEVFTDIVIFEKVEGVTTKARYTFNEVDGSYTLDESGEYQISDLAKFWLFVMYDCEGIEEETGNGTKYTDNHLTVEGLEDGVNDMSTAIIEATMRQLKDAGVITGTYKDSLLKMSLKEVLDTLNGYMPG